MISLSWNQVRAWRLSKQCLLQRAGRQQLLEVVAQVCGVHAQLMPAAELALLARIEDLLPSQVEEALWSERTLAKTWAMRGTLHLVPAGDLALYCSGLSASVSEFYRKGAWLKYHQVTLSELDALNEAVRATLTSTPIRREELANAVADATGIEKLRELLLSGWGALLKPAAHLGYLCFGPNQGQNVTFVRPDLWLGEWEPVEAEAALKEVVRRFLRVYGPATLEDFGRWWGVQPPKARKLFKALGDEIAPVEVEGWSAWALASSLEEMEQAGEASSVRLLPYFDPLTVEVYLHSQFFLPEAHKAQVYRPQGWIAPVVLVDGTMQGVWEYERKSSSVGIKVKLFAAQAEEVRQRIEAEAHRIAAYFGAGLQLEFAAS